MSVILNEAAIKAMRAAYNAYMQVDFKSYQRYLQEADNTIKAIRALGPDPDWMGREFELLCLQGEKTLIAAFAYIDRPKELLGHYKLAASQLAAPPSRILNANMAYLPPHACLFKVFPDPAENAEQARCDFAEAMAIYNRLTGGGAGVDSLYSGTIYLRRGEYKKARICLKEAKLVGGTWIAPHIENLLRQIESEKKQ